MAKTKKQKIAKTVKCMPAFYTPGDLVEIGPRAGWDETTAIVIPPPRGGFTDSDFMGRPYVWIMIAGRILQVPQSHIAARI